MSKLMKGTVQNLSIVVFLIVSPRSFFSADTTNYPTQSVFLKIDSFLSSLHIPIYPENSYTPKMPNTKRKRRRIIITYIRLGIAFNKLLTKTLIPLITLIL